MVDMFQLMLVITLYSIQQLRTANTVCIVHVCGQDVKALTMLLLMEVHCVWIYCYSMNKQSIRFRFVSNPLQRWIGSTHIQFASSQAKFKCERALIMGVQKKIIMGGHQQFAE